LKLNAHFFKSPFHNALSDNAIENLKNAIDKLPLLKNNEEQLNAIIIEQRKHHKRAYEPWTEEEITLFKQTIEGTNDIHFLSEVFQRNPGSLKSFYKKMIES
jgi:hypothetical protein